MAKQAETTTVAENTPIATEATPALETTAQPAAQSLVKPVVQTPTLHTAYFAGDPNAQHATSAATEGDKGKDAKTERLFTQEELEAIVKERISRVEKKYGDYDDLKAKATAADEATRSEAEKQAARLQELEQNAAKLAQERAKLVVENAFLVAATEVGLPAKAALKLADLDKAEYDANGNITNAKALAEAVAAEYPALIKRSATANVVNPGRENSTPTRTDADRRKELLGAGSDVFWQEGRVILPTSLTGG